MVRDLDRDKLIDALLEGARRDPASQEAGPACLDAEELAAWADGGLDGESVLEIEKHVADCARCQALSAAMFSSTGTVAAKRADVVTFRPKPAMDWLPLAIGTIAATVVIWMGVGRQQSAESPAQATATQARTAESAKSDESRQQSAQKQEGTNALAVPQSNAAVPKSNTAVPAEAKQAGGNAAPVETRADKAAPTTTTDLFRKPAEPVATPSGRSVTTPAPMPAPVLPSALPPPPATVAGASPVVGPPATATGVAAGVTGGAGGGVQRSTTLQETVQPRLIAEFSSVLGQTSTINGLPTPSTVAGGVAGAGAGRGGGGGGGRGGGRGGAALVYDQATIPPFYWRILSGDVIERSVDRLKWEVVKIDPPVQGLTGGTAPSATVCWIVGRAGLILRTTDGKEFTRVVPPAPADLIAIAAQDAMQATVTTAGGQMFTTADGGKTWK